MAFALALRPGGRGVNATCDLRDCRAQSATIFVAAFGFVEGWTCTLGASRIGARSCFLSREPRAGVVAVQSEAIDCQESSLSSSCRVCGEPRASYACLLVQRKSRADISR